MAINQIESTEKKKKSPLDTVMDGLGIVSTAISGISGAKSLFGGGKPVTEVGEAIKRRYDLVKPFGEDDERLV